jgi:hypothetical protein
MRAFLFKEIWQIVIGQNAVEQNYFGQSAARQKCGITFSTENPYKERFPEFLQQIDWGNFYSDRTKFLI